MRSKQTDDVIDDILIETKDGSNDILKDITENDADTIQWLTEEATKGSVIAQYNIALAYKTGNGVALNFKEAYKWFEKAAMSENLEAIYQLGLCYYYGHGTDLDFGKAFECFEKAAKAGHADAQFNLGFIYEHGLSREKNQEEAIKWYFESANQKNNNALYRLGVIYEEGLGVLKDEQKAFSYYQEAKQQGNRKAIYKMAVFYEEGKGVEIDEKTAYYLYQEVLKDNFLDATNRLARMTQEGRGTIVDLDKAIAYYKRAQSNGSLEAKYEIAYCILLKKDILSNNKEQYTFLKKTFNNFVKHQSVNFTLVARIAHMLADCNEHGLGCIKNEFLAQKYRHLEEEYKRAIENYSIDLNKVKNETMRKKKYFPAISVLVVLLLMISLIFIPFVLITKNPLDLYSSMVISLKTGLYANSIDSYKDLIFIIVCIIIVSIVFFISLIFVLRKLFKKIKNIRTLLFPLLSFVFIGFVFFGMFAHYGEQTYYSIKIYDYDKSILLDEEANNYTDFNTNEIPFPQVVEGKIFVGWKDKHGKKYYSISKIIDCDIELYPEYVGNTFKKNYSISATFDQVTGNQKKTYEQSYVFDFTDCMVLQEWGYDYYVILTTTTSTIKQSIEFSGGHLTTYTGYANVNFNDIPLGSVNTKVAANWFNGGSDEEQNTLSSINKRIPITNKTIKGTLSMRQELDGGDRATLLKTTMGEIIVTYSVYISR